MTSLKFYMVTRLIHLLESNLPHAFSLRSLWRKVMKEQSFQLPVIEELRGRGSHHGEFSFHTEVPVSKMPAGAKFVINVVYDPSRIVFSSVRVSLTITIGNFSHELVDIGLDVQGFENIAREFLGPEFQMERCPARSAHCQNYASRSVKTRKVPTFFFEDKTVVQALQELFQRVNMPSGDSPQAQLHIRLLGSDVGFLDLEDFIVIVKEAINPQSDKRPGRFQNLMQNIARGINLFIGKSQKMVEAKKIIPTVAGLPWHVQIDGTMVASAMLNVTNDISKFRKGDGPLESRGRLKASVAVAVSCRGAVHLGNFSKSGVQFNLSVLVNGETGGRLKLYFVPERKTTPRAQVLELGLEAPKHAINIFSIRSDLFTIHNDKYRTVLTPATQRQVQLCAPQFVQRWSGQRPCLSGFYQQTNGLSLTPFPLLSGPVYLDVRIIPADRALKEYTAAFTMTRDSTGIQARKQVFKADFSALGEELKRQCHIKVESIH
ncbi:uncharacterized protein LOC112573299 [Pomacea canaliculata]|uniref:uncharacterized protein LOC112573299 n=1 Tax=Pomacea canaliculata TaxID=400727 RepID=UPI000D735686|nr:uncharacterized protein LOC112573299 [Pomacea canaliculata]